MPPDHVFWISLAAKMALTAGFVVTASIVTERAGPVIGALVSTLPLSAGPGYAFLAMDHDAAFIAESAKTSLVLNAATCMFALAFAATAQRRALFPSLAAAIGVWLGVAYLARSTAWTAPAAILSNVVALTLCLPLARRYAAERMPSLVRRWYDAPLRACMVACLVATLVLLSGEVGPSLTGVIAVYPVVLTSLIIILQPRLGGPAAASVIANAIPGLIGFALALTLVHYGAAAIGKWTALLLGLLTTIVWNLGLWALWRSGAGARIALALNRLPRPSPSKRRALPAPRAATCRRD